MAKMPPLAGRALILCGSTMLLAACAAPVRAPAPSTENTAPPNPAIISGVLVAIRPVAGQSTLAASSADVLAALQLPIAAPPPNATEFVIQRNDGNIAAIVLPSPAASPDASLAASDFSLGDRVELITGAQTELIHRPP